MASEPNDTSSGFSPAPYVIAGYVTIALAFGVFGSWAATAPLASGAVAGGTVSVYSSRKVVQHLEGGIVSEILVREGDLVEPGDELLRLNPTQAQGNASVLRARYSLLRATEARLEAESVDAEEINFPDEIMGSPALQVATGGESTFIALQRTLFRDRKTTKKNQVAILNVRIEQLEEELVGLQAQRKSLGEQLASIGEEVERLTRGQEGGFVASNQIAQLSRAKMEIEGNLGQMTANIARTRQNIAETELQILQINQDYVERASSELRDIRDQVNETAERLKQAEDILERTVIRAPVRGMVQNIQIHTTTGIIRPAEHIMDIIPLDDDLIVNARVRPVDIDNVGVDTVAEVRFPAFSSRTTPVIYGTVRVISQDIIEPDDPRIEPYYVARIEVAEQDVPTEIKGRLVPGMPAEIILLSGERTLADYLLKPIQDALSKGLLEN
jgi:HlyD family type I secretion membrane fusion protein